MKKSNREALDAYYREAGSWAADRIGALKASRRIAWIVAGAACVVAVAEGVALMVMAPLKTVVPYTLMVDRTTGYVQALKPLDPGQTTPDRALIQSMLAQYVIAREGFDMTALQANYQKVGLWSAEQARTDYVALMQASNLDSPLTRYPRTTVVETRVKSVSPLSDRSALVRFDTIRRDEGGAAHPALPWVAVVEYRFSGEPMSAADRFVNPLGFQVLRYRRDPEALTPLDDAAPPPPMEQNASALEPVDAVEVEVP
jgi:type IV secretion system protein VirB8